MKPCSSKAFQAATHVFVLIMKSRSFELLSNDTASVPRILCCSMLPKREFSFSFNGFFLLVPSSESDSAFRFGMVLEEEMESMN